jgi:DNA-binding transcriptional LysR family regulator
MEIKRLRLFRAVVEAGGVTRAAELMHLTPGTISKAIRQIESDVGHVLFRRERRRLVVNAAGQRLYRESAQLIDEHARVRRCLDDLDEPISTTLRIASFEVFTTYCLAYNPTLHDASAVVHELPVEAIGEAVQAGEADVGVTYVPVPHSDLSFRRIRRIGFGCYVRAGTFDDCPFDAVPFAVPVHRIRGAIAELSAVDGWPYGRVGRLVRYRLTSLESALAMARGGHCAVFIPHFIAGLHNRSTVAQARLQRIDEPRRMPQSAQWVHAVTRTDTEYVPLVEAFLQCLSTVIDDGESAIRDNR